LIPIFSQEGNIDGTCRIMNKWSVYEASRLIGHDSFWMKSPRMARGTILFVTSDMFFIDDGYIGVSDVRPRAEFCSEKKKNTNGTWWIIIKIMLNRMPGNDPVNDHIIGKLNLHVASVRVTCIRCMLSANACKSFATCIRNHSVHAFPRGTYALRDAPQREAATMHVLTSRR